LIKILAQYIAWFLTFNATVFKENSLGLLVKVIN